MAIRFLAMTIGGHEMRIKGQFSERDALYAFPITQAKKGIPFICSASKESRGFGTQPSKKEKSNSAKISKEGRSISSQGSQPRKTKFSKEAPGLAGGSKFDRQFEERLESVRRSAQVQKNIEEIKPYQAIDYDAPLESEQSTIGLGTKVGVGVAVVVFGLVFALGDFLPSGSESPDEKIPAIEKKLTEEEATMLKSSLQQYEATLSVSPSDPTALEGAAVTLAELGEYNRAVLLLEKFIKERPKDSEAYRLLGEVKFELKDYEGSATAYKCAASASETINLEVLRGLTNALLAANKPDEAVKVLLDVRESLETQRLKNRDVLVDSIGSPEKQLTVDPIQVELLLGKAYSDWGHISDAVSVYDKLISAYPNDFRGYLAKGIILKKIGNVGDAERMFIQARFFASANGKTLVDRYSRQ